jgi:hypothetical protein
MEPAYVVLGEICCLNRNHGSHATLPNMPFQMKSNSKTVEQLAVSRKTATTSFDNTAVHANKKPLRGNCRFSETSFLCTIPSNLASDTKVHETVVIGAETQDLAIDQSQAFYPFRVQEERSLHYDSLKNVTEDASTDDDFRTDCPTCPGDVADDVRRSKFNLSEASDDYKEMSNVRTWSSETCEGVQCCSVGSIGHPMKCALPCKYVGKERGCKDGANCSRCHLCSFRRVLHGRKKRLNRKPAESW